MYRDILVIGAGAIGLSSALHLKRLNPEKSVLVVDSLVGPRNSGSIHCAAGSIIRDPEPNNYEPFFII